MPACPRPGLNLVPTGGADRTSLHTQGEGGSEISEHRSAGQPRPPPPPAWPQAPAVMPVTTTIVGGHAQKGKNVKSAA